MSRLVRAIVVTGLAAAAALTAIGVLAYWRTALDIVNNGLPVLTVGCLALLGLAFATGKRTLIGTAALLVAVNFALLLTGVAGAAPEAPQGSERFLRVATFNLWGPNDHADRIKTFLAETDPDALVLEEVRQHHRAFLDDLALRYPHRVGADGLVILSKYPIQADGRVDRAGFPSWMSLIVRWVRLDVNGTEVELAGVHLARPFYPELQQSDIVGLTQFVQGRSGPLILAGDFNMAPWTWKLKGFTRATGLGRTNTFHPTWPMQWKSVPLLPLVPIDNVFTSPHFVSMGTMVGPRLGSDHRPVIADIAISK
ncbi:MAG TPA: endonuclease/exonuclease/phosphatase family protein [Methyloceanibacter sp.]|nr:endonuclease/exonuclease/phosphatase family protein [Methyloceanibacter sp.]